MRVELEIGILLLTLAAPAVAELPALDPVPHPSIEDLSAGDELRLKQARDLLDEVLTAPNADPAEVAAAFGQVGQLYLLNDFRAAAGAALDNARRLDPANLGWGYYRGVLYQRMAELPEAEEAFESVLSQAPEDPATLVRLGQVYLDSGQLAKAVESFRTVLSIAPDSAAAYSGLGMVAYERRNWTDAIANLERAIELQPSATSVHHPLGLAYRHRGDLDKAREHLGRNQHGLVKFTDPLMDELTGLLSGAPPLLESGARAIEAGEVPLGLELLREAVGIAPEDAFAQYSLGLGLLEAGQPENSIAPLRKAVALDPQLRDAQVALGVALQRSGRLRQAREPIERALELDPDHHDARLVLAKILDQSGNSSGALEAIETVLAQAPAYLHRVRARAYLQRASLVAAADPVAAEADLRNAGELRPDLAVVHVRLGGLQLRHQRFGDAQQSFEAGLALEPRNTIARLGLARSLLLAGHDAAALGVLELGVELMPGDVRLRHLLARVLAASSDPGVRDPDRALRIALEVAESEATVAHLETVAMAYATLDDFPRAMAWQQHALKIATERGNHRLIQQARERLTSYEQERTVMAPWSGD